MAGEMAIYGNPNLRYVPNAQFSRFNPNITESAGSPAFCGELENDTFESSSGLGALGTTAVAGAGALGGGTGAYYFASNPIANLEQQTLNSNFYKLLDKMNLEDKINAQKLKITQTKGYNLAQLAQAESFDALPEEVKNYLKANKLDHLTPNDAKEAFRKAGTNPTDLNLETIEANIRQNFKGTEHYNKILQASTKGDILNKINNANTTDELKAIITANKEFFGISGADDVVKQEIENLAAKGKQGVAQEAENIISKATNYIAAKKAVIFDHIDTKTGKLLDTAPEQIKNLFKEFKWQQAKKYGAWGAGIAAGLAIAYNIFSGSKNKA